MLSNFIIESSGDWKQLASGRCEKEVVKIRDEDCGRWNLAERR
jgi:hypothetical protein